MPGHVLPFSEIRASDVAAAGGKAARLGELAALGFPVPPGFVVTADAYRELYTRLGVERDVEAIDAAAPDDRTVLADDLRRRILAADLPATLVLDIHRAHHRLVAGRGVGVLCAVRSSATAEDQASASFAGQHGTYYYVDAIHLLDMIHRCWASLWTDEAIAYRIANGVAHGSVAMAVVVQELVRSEVSGVAFTANPVTGARDEVVIEASWGMGAALVDGRVTPDRFVVAREGFAVRERRIADKRVMVPPHLPPGSDGRLMELPQDMRHRETLQPAQVEAVATWALKCEAHFGSPQDVEWTIARGRVHVLQSRPITAIGRTAIGEGVEGQWVLFKAIAENFSDPLTPLMIDLVVKPLAPHMRAIGGRPYTSLGPVRAITPYVLSDAELADSMYSMFGQTAIRPRLSPRKLPVALAAAVIGWLVGGVTLLRTNALPDTAMDGFRVLCRRGEEDPTFEPPHALRYFGVRVFAPIGSMPVLINLTSLRFAPWMAAVRALLRRWAPDAGPETAALLCAGTAGVLSAAMGRAIEALADEAKRSPRVTAILMKTRPDDALSRLRADPPARAFVESLDRFLAVHGHRAIREFEIRAPRWSEDPAPVLAMVRNFLALGPEAAGHSDKAVRAREDAEARVRAALARHPLERTLGLRWRILAFATGRARYFFKLRENSRFFHIMTIGVLRRKVLAVEARLMEEHKLKCADDIFFLRWHEIEKLRAGTLGWRDVEERVRERRMEHVRLSKATPPRTIGIAQPPAPERTDEAADRLEGQAASPGCYEGIARVIIDPALDAALNPGEVLVAPFTDPAWTPLFLTAGAAVVEVGSYLSHAGTIAREYGMPCVVDVTDCTRRIQTGMRLRVDGDRGQVHILDAGGTA